MLSFRDVLLAAVLIAIVGAVGYAGSAHNGFVWDDNFQILHNPSLHPDHPWESLFTSDVWAYLHPGRSGLSNYYRPLPMLAYRWLGGADPRPEAFRWASILFNVLAGWAACALMYLLSRRRGLSLAAALIFAAHPIHSEAVLWNSALSELGCTLFYFLAFCLYLLAWREPDQPVAHPRRKKKSARELPFRPARHRIWFIAAAVFSYFAALLWKEMALSFPVLVAAHAIMTAAAAASIQARLRAALIRSAPFFAMTVAYGVVRFAVLGYLAKVQQGWVLTPLQFGLSALRLVAEYWLKLLWPFPLNAYHVFTPARSFLDAGLVLSLLFVVAALGLIFRGTSRWPLPSFAAAWVFVTLLPVLNLRGVGANVFTERYLYIPSLGFCLLVAWLAAEAFTRIPGRLAHAAAVVATVAIVIASVMQVRARASDWASDFSLLSATLPVSPNSAVIHNGMGQVLRDQQHDLDASEREYHLGYDAAKAETPPNREEMAHALVGLAGVAYSRRQPAQSLQLVEQALALDPSNGDAHVSRGVALLALGRFDEAEKSFQEAHLLYPNDAIVTNGLGLVALSRHQPGDAVRYFSQVVSIAPNYPDGYNNLGRAWVEQGHPEQSLGFFRHALDLAPDNAVFHANFGVALGRAGMMEESRSEFEHALQIDPSLEWVRQSLRILDQMQAQRPR
jgi:Tfp pilus assembly protein PilF